MAPPATQLLRRETFVGEDRNIDARSIVTLIIFFVVRLQVEPADALVIWPVRIPLPLFLPRLYYKYLYSSSPSASPASPKEITASEDEARPRSPPAPPSTEKSTLHPPPVTAHPQADTPPQEANETERELKKSANDNAVERWYFTLGLETSPVIGVLLLLASTCIPGSVVRAGIVGSEGVRPYDIMTLFISFAYISVSLDATGGLRYLAFLVAAKASSSGQLLYSTFYGFWVIAGLIVGNDPLILSGTPFLSYFTSHAHIEPPTAYLFTHFQAANLVSALLVSSNPTNLVLTSAFGISFLSYSAWLALPTITGAVILFPILRWWLFNSKTMIPPTLNPPKVNPRDALKDPFGAIFGTILFLCTIALLIGLSAGGYLEGVEGVWTVTAPAACVMICRDMCYDLFMNPSVRHHGHQSSGGQGEHHQLDEKIRQIADRRAVEDARPSQEEEDQVATLPIAAPTASPVDEEKQALTSEASPAAKDSSPEAVESHRARQEQTNEEETTAPRISGAPQILVSPPQAEEGNAETSSEETTVPSASSDHLHPNLPQSEDEAVASGATTPSIPPTPIGGRPSSEEPKPSRHKLLRPLFPFKRTFPTFSGVFTRLPIPLIPFAFSMFILVESLQYTGWIRVWAGWWAAWAAVGGVAGSVWLMGMLGVIGCNIFGTNIGATVLLSRVMQFWRLTTPNVSDRTLYGGVFALAVSSNFGAYSFVFSASLAGLLWRGILEQKGLTVRNIDFIRWNTIPVIFTMIGGCLVVAGEVCVMYKT